MSPQAILIFAGILIGLIVVHEVGHFVAAKLTGVRVMEAGLGYPPRIWGKEFRGTIYSINLIPLGGFVRMLGEEDPSDSASLAAKPAWARLIVLGAGSAMNFALPFILFTVSFMIARDVPVGLTQIVQVVNNSPAQEAGLKKSDVIFAINDHEVRNLQEAGTQIRLNLGETLTMRVKREGDFLEVPVHARWAAPDIVHIVEPDESASSVASLLGFPVDSVREAAGIEYRLTEGQQLAIQDGNDTVSYEVRPGDSVASVARALGVDEETVRVAADLPDPEELTPGQELRLEQGPTGITIGSLYPGMTESESFPLWEAFPKSIETTFQVLTLARNEIISWFKGGGAPAVAGPVGIAQVTGEVVEEGGYRPLLDFAALLSINLAIINILPLPMLDGGRIMFVLLEIARRGKRVAPEKEALVHFIGLVLILTLAVVIAYFDVVRVLRGESLFR